MSDSTETTTNDSAADTPVSRKKNPWVILIGIVVALGIAGAGWAVLRDSGGEAGAPDASGASDETRTVESTRTVEDTSTVVIEPEGGDTDPEYVADAEPPLMEQYTALVTDVSESAGSYIVTLDYVQLLTGDEAKKAAEAKGEKVTERGLYVVNDNPITRERAVAPDLTVRVTIDTSGKPNQLGRTLPLAEWASAIKGPQADAFRDALYIVTLTNGTVTLIDQHYMP